MQSSSSAGLLLRERGNLQNSHTAVCSSFKAQHMEEHLEEPCRTACISRSNIIVAGYKAILLASQIDDVLGQASAVSGNLKDQRGVLSNVGSKLEDVAARFPLVTGLLNAIRRRKNRVWQSNITNDYMSWAGFSCLWHCYAIQQPCHLHLLQRAQATACPSDVCMGGDETKCLFVPAGQLDHLRSGRGVHTVHPNLLVE